MTPPRPNDTPASPFPPTNPDPEALLTQHPTKAGPMLRREHAPDRLSTTDLVHRVYEQMLLRDDPTRKWESRRHFFAAAALAMRSILVDEARRRNAQKRGGGARPVSLAQVSDPVSLDPGSFLEFDEELTELAKHAERAASVVSLRVFAGLDHEAIAGMLGVSAKTVQRDWDAARVWLARRLSRDEG